MEQLPAAVAALREQVDAELAAVGTRIAERMRGLHPELAPLGDELAAAVRAGGKRLRPVLVLVGYRAAGGPDLGAAMGPALAVELLHTCAIVHDDLIDGATTRRGRPAAHLAFRDRHVGAGWPGDAEAFGEAAALLLGDLAFVVSDELFLNAALPPDRLLAAFRLFTTMREEVTAGQYLDVVAAHTRSASPTFALAVASYKSGRYSVSRPLEIGATLAAGAGAVSDGLARVGLPLGQAFQLRDDVLGVFGSEAETGKSTTSDLAEGKRTLLVALTTERLEDADRARLGGLLGDPELTREDAEVARALIRTSGGLDATEATIDRLVAEAMRTLQGVPIPAQDRALLRDLADFLIRRRA